jgi:hypothetical protein
MEPSKRERTHISFLRGRVPSLSLKGKVWRTCSSCYHRGKLSLSPLNLGDSLYPNSSKGVLPLKEKAGPLKNIGGWLSLFLGGRKLSLSIPLSFFPLCLFFLLFPL